MRHISLWLLLCMIQITMQIQAKVVILIHGTWASQASWYRQGGNFHSALKEAIPHTSIISFAWSGKFERNERLEAGKRLATLIDKIPAHHDIIVIGHSHGGNIALIATGHCTRIIKHIVLLGTPIMPHHYQPVANKVEKISNVFSLQDFIQPIGTMCQRVLACAQCCNIRIQSTTIKIGHEELHHPMVAAAIPLLLAHTTTEPQYLEFNDIKPTTLIIDHQQESLVARNRKIILRMIQLTQHDTEHYRNLRFEW